MKWLPRAALVGLALLAACAQQNAPPPYAPEQSSSPSPALPASTAPSTTPAHGFEATATPDQTLADLERTPITQLDFGLYRLREEYLPEMEQQLRSQGRVPDAGTPRNAAKAGLASIKMMHVDFNPDEKRIEISVATADSRDAASTQTVSRLEALQTSIIAAVRRSFGGECPGPSVDPATAGAACEAARHFYGWFERPGVNGNSEPVNARDRAAYNLYSLVQVTVGGHLAGSGGQKPVSVSCKAPLIRDEVKCTSSEFP